MLSSKAKNAYLIILSSIPQSGVDRLPERILKTKLLIIKMLSTTFVRLWCFSALSITLGSYQMFILHLNSLAVNELTVLQQFY